MNIGLNIRTPGRKLFSVDNFGSILLSCGDFHAPSHDGERPSANQEADQLSARLKTVPCHPRRRQGRDGFQSAA